MTPTPEQVADWVARGITPAPLCEHVPHDAGNTVSAEPAHGGPGQVEIRCPCCGVTGWRAADDNLDGDECPYCWVQVKRMRKVYVAGPMRGYAKYNFPAFEAACAELRAAGYAVLSPHEHDLNNGFDPDRPLLDQGFDLRAALRWDLDAVLSCDLVVILTGWEHSQGAQAEVAVACVAGIPYLALDAALQVVRT